MNIISKIKSRIWVISSIIPTIYFNFHYLPFKQAIKLPILLCKPTLLRCEGQVIINSRGG